MDKTEIAEANSPVADTIEPAGQDVEIAVDSSTRSDTGADAHMFHQLLEVTAEAAKGNIEIRALHCDPSTDMGELGISVNHLLDMTDAFLREAGASMEHASEEKFYRRVLLRGMRGTFRHKANLINQALETMSSSSASLKEAERLILTSAQMAQEAVRETSEASKTVKRLGEASLHVGEVVKLISQIASQTNLLAINAKIEAAHVGDAGRGFKVVADEVRSLAQKTADATGGIARDIAAITGEIAHTTVAMEALSKSIVEMQEISASIERVVTDQKSRNANAITRSSRGNHARTKR